MTSPNAAATPERAEAQQVKARYAMTVSHVRGNKDLTDAARNRQIAELHAEQRDRLQRLRQQEQERLAADYAKTEKDLFRRAVAEWNASPGDMVALRDAQDRASQVKRPEDAHGLLDQAEASGDEQLAATVARNALHRSADSLVTPGDRSPWLSVVEKYISHPARVNRLTPIAEKMDALNALREPSANGWDDFSTVAPPEARKANVFGGFAGGDDSGSTNGNGRWNFVGDRPLI